MLALIKSSNNQPSPFVTFINSNTFSISIINCFINFILQISKLPFYFPHTPPTTLSIPSTPCLTLRIKQLSGDLQRRGCWVSSCVGDRCTWLYGFFVCTPVTGTLVYQHDQFPSEMLLLSSGSTSHALPRLLLQSYLEREWFLLQHVIS